MALVMDIGCVHIVFLYLNHLAQYFLSKVDSMHLG
jgi:hypothetical protein